MTDVDTAPQTMGPDEYRMLIEHLGLTQHAAAAFFGVSEVTGRRWCAVDGGGPSPPVAKFLRYMVSKGLTPEKVDRELARSFLFGKRGRREERR